MLKLSRKLKLNARSTKPGSGCQLCVVKYDFNPSTQEAKSQWISMYVQVQSSLYSKSQAT